ncbi:unnamed protein product [Rotaria socialis]|uniref:Uncharacterized protein n=1 Tax=Rotaria socialis TaxID=392032 RepID=A0A820IL40_9BILA|nr:unnamed protein product [Rotaria socialis]CAF3434515.1 unnamed protein product [Rotaria socialis]CAF4292002.1 unnamed protein product [Rotaria socialis]CAF4312841.1 unnamed protein product [Rotaria socialis]
MAGRDDQHYHQKIHYASILPTASNSHTHKESHLLTHKPTTQQDRSKALYLDFESAFQDDTTNQDYFGLQFPEHSHQNTHQLANFHLQSVETISEVKNSNFSPYVRYHASRETSHSSTPSDTPPPFPLRHNQRSSPFGAMPSSHSHHVTFANDHRNLNRNFSNLKMISSNDNKDIPIPFTPDAILLKTKQQPQQQQQQLQETTANSSSQSKLILPQYFFVKYLGRVQCAQLWGAKAVRAPIDDMVRSARQFSSMSEIPTLEACVNTRGLTLTHQNLATQNKQNHSRNPSPERHQHGLIPLENISYAMHDIKYSKIASCIVLRQAKSSSPIQKNTTETLTECYTFLFQSKEHAHRFALALAEAFNTQKQPVRTSRQNNDEQKDGRSPQRHSRHRSAHRHDRIRTAGKYDRQYLGDTEV